MEDKRRAFREYIDRTIEIRRLSTPSLEEIANADGYSERLTKNFIRIGQLAGENREFLDNVVFPFTGSQRELTVEEIQEMTVFGNEMINSVDVEYLDLPIVFLLSERILKEIRKKGDMSSLIRQLDTHMDACYALMLMAERIPAAWRISNYFSQEGLRMGEYFISLLEHDKFAGIEEEECREIVLTNARYISAFFPKAQTDPEVNAYNLAILERMYKIAEDEFYHKLVPEFDWRYFKYRVLEYISLLGDYGNQRGFDEAALAAVCDYTEKAWELWHSDVDYFAGCSDESQLKLRLMRNRYLVGRLDENSYKEQLISLYCERNPKGYALGDIENSMMIPAEYITLLKQEELTAQDKYVLKVFYQNMLTYVFQMPNSETLVGLMEIYVDVIERFVEVPSVISFEEMILQSLAAFHPPTYVHSVMVGQITECLCGHLIRMRPELFTGILDTGTVEEVMERKAEIIDFAYHAALCHDAGKISIIDTIFVYGRRLTDMEFDIIKTHPRTGYELLSRYVSTRKYADVALGHHKWYDNSKGYPEEFDTAQSPVKTIIDIVQCADCMDAATDSIGRSYNKGKSLSEFMEELSAESGTRYAPWLLELLEQEKVFKDVEFLLTEERKHNYQKTYYLLRGMQEQTVNF